MTNIYIDGSYLERNSEWHVADSPWKAAQIQRMINANGVRFNTCCEVGCGAGEVLKNLKGMSSAGQRFHGFEISPHAYDRCRGLTTENLEFHFGDLLSTTEQFDLVLAIDVFEHVDDYLGFLAKLRDHGRAFIFHIPLDLSVQSVFRSRPILTARQTVGHLHYFTKETALASLEYAGYRILDHFYTASDLELPHRGWKANAMKLPRSVLFRMNQDLSVRLLGGYSLLVYASNGTESADGLGLTHQAGE